MEIEIDQLLRAGQSDGSTLEELVYATTLMQGTANRDMPVTLISRRVTTNTILVDGIERRRRQLQCLPQLLAGRQSRTRWDGFDDRIQAGAMAGPGRGGGFVLGLSWP